MLSGFTFYTRVALTFNAYPGGFLVRRDGKGKKEKEEMYIRIITYSRNNIDERIGQNYMENPL